jgi:hypothetical protein
MSFSRISIYLLPIYLPTGRLTAAPTFEGHQEVTGVIGNMVLVNTGFYTRKNFSENYPQFGHARHQNFASPVNRLKNLKECRF